MCPECGLKSAFAKFTMKDCLVDKVGVINLPSVTVTVLEATKIDGDLRSPTDVEPFVLTIK